MGVAIAGAIIIGVAVDDTIHFLVKYFDSRKRGLSMADTFDEVLHYAGKAIFFTTVVLSLSFSVFAFSTFTPNQNFGVVTATALVIALIIDLLYLPALLHMADKRADELSGGQRQRVGICRALIQDPALLLVDEPTASLDPKTSREIMRLITEMCRERGLAAIINIHDVNLAQMFVQRVVALNEGAIIFDGGPTELTPDVLTRIYGEEDWEATIETVTDEEGEA